MVGQFFATDPSDPIQYFLVDGDGDDNNSKFILETNGSLLINHSFNLVRDTNLSIRVSARDDKNFTTEGVSNSCQILMIMIR